MMKLKKSYDRLLVCLKQIFIKPDDTSITTQMQKTPLYLETAEFSNIHFYEKLGFRLIRELTEPVSKHTFVDILKRILSCKVFCNRGDCYMSHTSSYNDPFTIATPKIN